MDEILRENSQNDNSQIDNNQSGIDSASTTSLLGEIIWLMGHSELHRGWPIGGIQQWVYPAIINRQFRIYRRNGKPHGYISWAWMSEDVEQQYILNTGSLLPEGWKSGERGWIIDFIAPFGDTREIVHDLKYKVFKDDVGRYLRVRPGEDTMHIHYVHGANAVRKDNPTVDLKAAEKRFG